MINEYNSESSQPRIITIQKTPRRAFHHLKTLGKFAGIPIFSAVFYLFYWKDSSIRAQYGTFFWWLTLIFSAGLLWWSEVSQTRHPRNQMSPQRGLPHLKALGKIAGYVMSSVIVDLVFLKDNRIVETYELYLRCFTLIFAGAALWLLARDWFMTGNMTFTFDGDKGAFSVEEENRSLFELPFQAIKRIKIEESSNLFPVYILSIHLQDGQRLEMDSSASQEEMNGLAQQLADLTSKKIVIQKYDEPLSKEEKEEQRQLRNEVYRGD